jgi:hypothetical protein
VDVRRGSSASAARRADRPRSSDRPEGAVAAASQVAPVPAVVVEVAASRVALAPAVVAAAADGARRSSMQMPKCWPWAIVAMTLGLGVAQTAALGASEPQRGFPSAEDAVTAFVAALRDHNEGDLRAILGPEADRAISSGDRHADQELQKRFLALYDEQHAIDHQNPDRAELDVGANDWPLPIPLVEKNGRWTFDTKAGAQTMVDRRIGRNELSAIRTLLACVDAQHDYFDRSKQATSSGVYATRFLSTPGHRDGLYWPTTEDEVTSPLGPLIDAALNAGYPGQLAGGKPIPYGGYYFRILKTQGPNGDGGAKSYVQSGRMTGGFALSAWPAAFESSGIMTFIVGPDGDVYQKDLGPQTARIASAMTTFDPDLTWSRVTMTND